jgi:hypothetical protein
MSRSLQRRLDGVEKACVAGRRTHFVFWDEGDTEADVQAKKRALIASGRARPYDRIITFTWKYPRTAPPTASTTTGKVTADAALAFKI